MKAVLDHVGIAVSDVEAARAFYRDALGLDIEPPEEVASQQVRAHFIPVGEAKLELLESTAPGSAIARYVEGRGPGLHHITLRVDDIRAALARVKAHGARLVDEEPREGAEGALVAFIHPSAARGVLVELKQAAPLPAAAREPGATPQAEGRHRSISRFTVGDLELISLCDGFIRLDGGAMFGTVPKTLWSRTVASDERNRITLAMRPLVVRGMRTMIIDAGLGDKHDDAFIDRYGVDRARNLDHALAEAGLGAGDVDIVLATHLHFDHAGGFTVRDSNGCLRPRFPRAQYIVRRGEWEEATHPNARTRGSYVRDDFWPLAEAGVLQLVDEDCTIMPGVRVRRTGGHTPHHQMALIESGREEAAFVGDLIPTSAHLAVRWITAYDLNPLETLAAKQRFVTEATSRGTLVLLEHDPAVAAGYLREEEGRTRLRPHGSGESAEKPRHDTGR
jgi:methylmalonyl-CoA epimerase